METTRKNDATKETKGKNKGRGRSRGKMEMKNYDDSEKKKDGVT